MRRWILLGVPAVHAAALGMHAGGGVAALWCWLALGAVILPAQAAPYPKCRRLKLHRLFLALGMGSVSLLGLDLGVRRLCALLSAEGPLARGMILSGAVFFALMICERTLTLLPPRRFAWAGGAALCALSLLLYFL